MTDSHAALECRSHGSGAPVVVLHRDLGPIGLEPLAGELASTHQVHLLSLPGFGESPLPGWARSVAHLAALTGRWLDARFGVAVPLVGLGFGGWVAAELAAYSPQRVEALVLASPLGLRPDHGEVVDQFLWSARRYAELSAGGEESFARLVEHVAPADVDGLLDQARDTVTRVSWKPIGHDPALAGLLADSRIPAAIVWGADDAIIPATTAPQWQQLLGVDAAKIVDDASHHVELTHAPVIHRRLIDLRS